MPRTSGGWRELAAAVPAGCRRGGADGGDTGLSDRVGRLDDHIRPIPTVTIYNHMDVQPAQEPEWKQAPFAFQKDNGIYRGRGATDDKGPALPPCSERGMPLSRACRSTFVSSGNWKKKTAARVLRQRLRNRAAIPRPDSVVVSDTIWLSKTQPAMPYGFAGLLGARLVTADRS